MRSLFKIFPLLAVSLVISCGQSDNSGGGQGTRGEPGPNGSPQNETVRVDGSNIDGIYAAEIYPVNYNLQFKQVGMTALQREGDNFKAIVKMDYGSRNTNAIQGIYTGTRCPNLSDDKNKDAYIDIQEAMAAIGSMTIPLDGVLDSQQAGGNVFPLGEPVAGKYFYQSSASFERMFADLKVADENPSDNITKLGESDGLIFTDRILLIQGMPDDVVLPPTVTSVGSLSAHRTMPVACAILRKVEKLPEGLEPHQI